MEVTSVKEPVASPELEPQVVETLTKVQKAIYPTFLFQNIGCQGLFDKHELWHGRFR